jgi:hypothetical protein
MRLRGIFARMRATIPRHDGGNVLSDKKCCLRRFQKLCKDVVISVSVEYK